MEVARWSPFQEVEALERRMSRLLGEPGGRLPPAADVYETDEEFVVELEVPGFEEKELEVEISDHTLTITGARHEDIEKKDKAFKLRERLDRQFERAFRLPPGVDPELVKASFASGVLKVEAGKTAAAKALKVPITS